MNEGKYLVAYVTSPPDEAAALARALVDRGLAACVNIVPQIQSIYRWEGEVCEDAEALLVAKTTADRFEAFREAVLALHSADLPEIIALPIQAGHAPYLDWIGNMTAPATEGA